MHTHIKLGAHALLNDNHSYHVDFESLCSTRWFRSWCSTRWFRSWCSTRWFKSLRSTCWIKSLCSNTLIGTTCILHSQVVVVLLRCRWCRVVVVELLSCCRCFKYQAEIIEAYVKYYCCLIVVVYVVKFRWWIICLLLLNVNLTPSVWMLPLRG